MRRRYASRGMVGMLRAWKASADVGFARDERDADVRDVQRGVCAVSSGEVEWEYAERVCEGSVDARASLVDAIWVSKDARNLSKSAGE